MIETLEAVEIEKQKHNSTRMEALARLAKLEVQFDSYLFIYLFLVSCIQCHDSNTSLIFFFLLLKLKDSNIDVTFIQQEILL